MAQTVGYVIDRAKRILQESGEGTRWTDSELVGWLNEAYLAVCVVRPDASAKIDEVTLSAGAKQQLPEDGLRLMDVVSGGIRATTRRALDTMRPGWQSEPSGPPEMYAYDDLQPATYWIYPPAASGDSLTLSYTVSPKPHDTASLQAVRDEALSISDRYAQPLLDFVLYRAFSKDAETQANAQRSTIHYQAFSVAIESKSAGDAMTSPNGAPE